MAPTLRTVTLMPIKNMNRAIRFYTKALGAKLGHRGQGPMRDMWASLKLGGADVWFIVPERFEKRKLAYTTFLVKNIRASVRALSKNGVRFERASRGTPQSHVEGPIVVEPFGAGAFFKDSEGNLLMLWENNPPM